MDAFFASQQHAQENAAMDAFLADKAKQDPCVNRKLPLNSNLNTCQLQKELCVCSEEHNQFPDGFCAELFGNCPSEATVGHVKMDAAVTEEPESGGGGGGEQ